MHKLLVFFIVCFAISLTIARENKFKKKDSLDFNHKSLSSKHRKLATFCSNNTAAQAYLKQVLLVIDELQSNSSYDSILNSQSANFVTYLKDVNNQKLLMSDCEGFINGLLVAKKADKIIERTRKHLISTIRKQIKQVARTVNNGKGFDEFDS